MNKYLEIGMIVNKRGLKGEIKVEHYCNDTETAMSFEKVYLDSKGEKELKVLSAKEYKGYVYYLLEGIDTAEKADSVRGKLLYADRDDIPMEEGEVFISDIIGLPVIDATSGEVYGKLVSVDNYGASDVYTVKRPDKSETMMPANEEFIEEIDLDKGIFVNVIPGIFDDGAISDRDDDTAE